MSELSSDTISAKAGIKMPPDDQPLSKGLKKPAAGYDKYINWKIFFVPVLLFFGLLFLPTPDAMKDVGAEYQVGPKAVKSYIVATLFNAELNQSEQWQLLTANIMEQNMRMGALTRDRFLKRDVKWCKKIQDRCRRGQSAAGQGVY